MTDFLGRDSYERQEEAVGYRTGYKPGRMRSAESEIELAVPQVRDSEQSYRSRLMDFLKGHTDVLDYRVLQMYTRGLSTRDVEDAFRDPVTGELLLGRTGWNTGSLKTTRALVTFFLTIGGLVFRCDDELRSDRTLLAVHQEADRRSASHHHHI